jgi:uncharacterized membrane protein
MGMPDARNSPCWISFLARRYLHAEIALFVLLLVFAAAMARGYGEF